MKRKFSVLAFLIAILMCFLTIGAFAVNDNSSSQMPFVDAEEISPEFPDIQTEDDAIEVFEEIFGESGGIIFVVSMVGVLFMLLFLPALAVVIVFGVLNGKTKKKVKEYERFFGPIPKKQPTYYNPNMYNSHYTAPPVNLTGAPIGTTPEVNHYIPQNDMNNQQGGQF